MNIPVALILSLLANWLGSVIRKGFADRSGGSSLMRHLYNGSVSLVTALVLLLWGGFGSASPFTLILGAVFGVVTACQQIFYLKALEAGPWSYTSVICSLSMLIPALSGCIIWGEQLRAIQLVGIAFMIVCFVLSGDPRGNNRKATLRWLLLSMLVFLCTGAIGVLQKWQQTSSFREELNAFLITSFAVSFLYSAGSALFLRPSLRELRPAAAPLPILMLVLGGVCAAANNKLNLQLSGLMESAIFFPLFNGGALILTALTAFLLFRERLSRRQWVGLASGFVAVLLLCLG